MESYSILVVVANATNRALMAHSLEDASYAVIQMGNGAAAVRSAEKTRPDVVILDMRLPWEDSDAVARSLKMRHPTLPILALSGLPTLLPALLHPDVTAVLGMPYEIDDLLALVERLCTGTPRPIMQALPLS